MRAAMEDIAAAPQAIPDQLSDAEKTSYQQKANPADEQTKHREDEIVFYAKMSNPEGLKLAASKESHEQWEIKTKKGKVRVRKTTKEGLEATHEMTFKVKSSNAGIEGGTEQNNSCDLDLFNSFKEIANSGMIKDRFCFPVTSVQIMTPSGPQDVHIEGIFYEVDVFFNSDDTYNLYIKIDLEMNKMLEALKAAKPDLGDFKLNVKLLDLPFKPIDVIISKGMTDEEKAIVDNLYETVFIKKNTGIAE